MKRKLVWVGGAYLAALFACAMLPQPWLAWLGLPLVACAVRFLFHGKRRELLTCLIAFSVGCGLYQGYDALIRKPLSALDGQTVQLSGRVLEVQECASDQMRLRIRTRLNGVSATVLYYGESRACRYGDEISMQATLGALEDSYLFPEQSYYRSEGIFLCVEEAQDVRMHPDSSRLRAGLRGLFTYRDRIAGQIHAALPQDEAALLCSMLLGDKSGLDPAAKTALYRTGIGHVTAVSGLHVTLLATLLIALLSRLGVSRKGRFAALVVGIALFAVCTGGSASVLRAGIMLGLVYGAELVVRRADPLNSLCIALMLLTIAQPFAILSPSLLLSASGVFAIGVFAPWLTASMPVDTLPQRTLRRFAQFSCVTIALLPVSALFFDEASLLSPLANLVLIPVCMVALVCGMLVFLSGGLLGVPLLWVAGVCCRVVSRVCVLCAGLPGATMALGLPFLRVLLPALLGVVCLSAIGSKRRRVTCWALVLSLLVYGNSTLLWRIATRDELRIAVLGRGSACTLVISQGGHTDLIDLSGKASDADYAAKYLTAQGISDVSNLILPCNPQSLIHAYQSALPYARVSTVYLPQDAYLLPGTTLFGTAPLCADLQTLSIAGADWNTALLPDGVVRITYGATTLQCQPGALSCEDAPDVLVLYDTPAAAAVRCGVLVSLADAGMTADAQTFSGQNNLLIRLQSDGRVSVRPL